LELCIGEFDLVRYNPVAVAVSLHSGDRLWTRSGPEGSSRSDWFGCCDRVYRRCFSFYSWITSNPAPKAFLFVAC